MPAGRDRRQRFPAARVGASPLDAEALSRALTESPHRPLLLREVMRCLQPRPGDVVVDATLGGGGHAQAILPHIAPRGRLIGVDADAPTLAQSTSRLRERGFGAERFTAHAANFAELPWVLAREGLAAVDLVLVDLGVSTMQVDDVSRGFSQAVSGPLDLRLDPSRGETAAQLLARIDAADLARLLASTADEPHAEPIARALAGQRLESTHALERAVRTALKATEPGLTASAVRASIRRTRLAVRIAVNDELSALDRLLDALPASLAFGGRVVVLTFHSGEDRRVKQAFREGHRSGVYASISREVIRSTTAETRADRRAMAAKLRWAVRAAS